VKKPINIDAFVKIKLRRASVMWPARNEAKSRARVSRGNYKCEACGSIKKAKEIELDHKDPVVPLTGQIMRLDGSRIDYNAYIDRLFCPADGFSVLCINCHTSKTETESEMRKHYRNEKKPKKKRKRS
jgi:hypothetical protein